MTSNHNNYNFKPKKSSFKENTKENQKEGINNSLPVNMTMKDRERLNGIIKLNLIQKAKLELFGSSKIGHIKKKGWKEQVPVYAFNCKKHGIVYNTPKGHMSRLICPECQEEKVLDENIVDQTTLQLKDTIQSTRS